MEWSKLPYRIVKHIRQKITEKKQVKITKKINKNY